MCALRSERQGPPTAGSPLFHKHCSLSLACEKGHLDVVELLLEHGAPVHTVRARGADWSSLSLREDSMNEWLFLSDTVNELVMAAQHGHAAVVALLLEHGSYVNVDRGAALLCASEHGHAEVVELLIARGARVRANRNAALREAAENGHTAVVRLLLQAGADVCAGSSEALLWATRMGHADVVQLLTQAGAALV